MAEARELLQKAEAAEKLMKDQINAEQIKMQEMQLRALSLEYIKAKTEAEESKWMVTKLWQNGYVSG